MRVVGFVLICASFLGAACARVADGPRQAARSSGTSETTVDVGGYSLWIRCTGEGSPTVVFENAWGKQPQANWWREVQAAISPTTRACVYERAGIGRSEPRLAPEVSAAEMADELQALLSGAGVEPPYVLVGHSFGGVIARIFTAAHPNEVAGMVLVDAASERFYDANSWEFGWEGGSHVNIAASADELRQTGSLLDRPLVVLEEGHGSPLPGPRWDSIWGKSQRDLRALSTDSTLVQAPKADHYIQLDQPKVVIEAIREVVTAVRDGTGLPPCAERFPKVGGVCL